MPAQAGAGVMSFCCQVCGSYQTSWRRASATEIAYVPSGVKYMLYGSITGIGAPGRPVFGSNGSRWLPTSSVAYSVCMSYDGTTCWSSRPAGYFAITANVLGSITQTSPDPLCGT